MKQLELFPELSPIVDSPSHYTQGGIETFDYIKAKLKVDELRGHCKATIISYLSRANYKHDDEGQADTLKALWYMKRLAETYEAS
jgi:hypothetical protein